MVGGISGLGFMAYMVVSAEAAMASGSLQLSLNSHKYKFAWSGFWQIYQVNFEPLNCKTLILKVDSGQKLLAKVGRTFQSLKKFVK